MFQNRRQGLKLVACGLIALGVAVPQVSTGSGYTYSMAGWAAILGYVTAVALAVLALFEKNLPSAIAGKLHLMGLVALTALVAWSGYLVVDGLRVFDYQTAADMSTWATVDADAYWARLYELAGLTPGNSVFNDLRTAHAQFGPGVTLNGSSVFYDTINLLSRDQVRQLAALPGGGYTALPWGWATLACGAAIYVLAHKRGRTARAQRAGIEPSFAEAKPSAL